MKSTKRTKPVGKKQRPKCNEPESKSRASSSPLPSFLELKKQQASFLFIAWDEDDTGRISSQQLRPIMHALFSSPCGKADAVPLCLETPVLSTLDIREGFNVALGTPMSQKPFITLDELLSVLDVLWSSPERRQRMVRASLFNAYLAIADTEEAVTREVLIEACNRITGTVIGEGTAETVIRSTVAGGSSHGSGASTVVHHCPQVAMDFEGLCSLLLPSLAS
ncbi:hypothetical protein ERJ75_000240300 [Trypanosoma vivax]|uniref:EF-hand domain-containing protein n=1 Tax=Trypanosoma vivax (strain Y486) TaxID=1055687 RepID=F9WV56_TRYVY|nr:hypothetical protein ERJ75_000240300 [Trypanosoma vivax]CCD21461.1 hypothetical protein, conserved [Trypanosoma vivax Y486]|eukprot:CCD21461.1 hypothetical protein, conserved [Trypanosoma vivax Y486]